MRLRVPGPTPVPPEVLRAMGRQVTYHRSSEFQQLLQETARGLQPLFGTQNATPLLLASSGTGALEATLVNSLSPGDRVVTLDNGHWGARFGRLASSLGLLVDSVASSWGSGADADALQRYLVRPENNDIAAVLVAHNDTFTGAVSDLAVVGRIVRESRAILIVDAVSSLGCMPIQVDEWALDMVASASQKGLMCPPGLAMLTVSPKAWARIESVPVRGEYFDLQRARTMAEKGQTVFTPAVNSVYALHAALSMIHEVGVDATYERHRVLGRALAAGAAMLGLDLFPQLDVASPCVSVLQTPDDIDAGKMVELLRERYATIIAGARRSPLDGKVIRIGTMGYCSADDIRLDVLHLAGALRAMGRPTDVSAATAAVEHELEGAQA